MSDSSVLLKILYILQKYLHQLKIPSVYKSGCPGRPGKTTGLTRRLGAEFTFNNSYYSLGKVTECNLPYY